MKTTSPRSTRTHWLLLATLLAGGAVAQVPAGLPPSGTMSAKMPVGMEIYMSMAVSDANQHVSQQMGTSEVEAKMRAMKDCNDKYKGCVELITFPIRNHCMGMASDKGATGNARGLFINVAETGKTQDGELANKSLEQCKAGGGTQCEAQTDYCF